MCFCDQRIRTPNCGSVDCNRISNMASDLKHLDLEQLQQRLKSCRREIGNLRGKINNEETRCVWIQHYINEKTPCKMTIEQIEQKLGYRIEIEDS